MAFNKRTWKGRQGTGLNKFSINGASPVTVVNQPDSITEVGDALSAGNLNDLEDRIADAFDETASQEEVTGLKNALTAVDHRVQNLESAKGDYVAVDSDKGVITTPSGKGKWAVVEKLRGVSRAENQLHEPTVFATTIGGVAVNSTSEGYFTLSGTASSADQYGIRQITPTIGHKYLIANCFAQRRNGGSWVANINSTDMSADIFDTTGWNSGDVCTTYVYVLSGTTYNVSKKYYPLLRDLTLYFGSTVPTLAEIQTYYPWLLEPSDYGTSLVDSVYEGVKSVGVNIWDEEWEIGNYGSNGEKISGSSLISKNMIPVKPSTAYYFYEGFSPAYHNVYYYDANGTYISKNTTDVTAFTTPSNCYFMNFALAVGYGTSYRNDITIAEGSSAVTYHPYMESTLSLPTPITLRSAGSVAEEFDLKTGEKTNTIGSYTFTGSEIWSAYGAGKRTNITGAIAKIISDSVVPNAFSDILLPIVYRDAIGLGSAGISITGDSNGSVIIISDSSLATNGKTIYFELATPTTEQLEPIQNPTILTESGGTISAQTEEPIDGNFSVGFITL